MERCYVKAYFDWIEQTCMLSDAEKGRLFISIIEYARSGLIPEGSGREVAMFFTFKTAIDRDAARSAQLSEYGAMGGRGNKADKSQQKPNKADESQAKPTKDIRHKTQDIEHKTQDDKRENAVALERKAASRFTPPTVAEVAEYCRERGNTVDADRFVDFYTSKGWMVGKNRMKDWKAAVRQWERGEDYGGNGKFSGHNKPKAGGSSKKWDIEYSG